MTTTDPYNLQRFLGAQESFYAQALKEIRDGSKTSHWIWFIFPQVRGLGHSPMSENYGIGSLDEAKAYLDDPVLRSRLVEISTALLIHAKGSLFRKTKSAEQIFGYTDALKVRSCMTLFDLVEPDSIFQQVLEAFFNGERDDLTFQILELSHNSAKTHIYPCLGALVGDTIGSPYEFNNIKITKFPLFCGSSFPTDDSVMTMAIADWLANTDRSEEKQIETMVKWGKEYPHAGYGGGFGTWIFNPKGLYDYKGNVPGERAPYYSWGNGSAMRCSACGWAANSVEEAIALGRQSAIVSHNHPEGLRGAEATSAAIFLARQGSEKEEVRKFIEERFFYDLHMDCDEIRPKYGWEDSCQGTVPPAIIAFLDSWNFESAIRLAVSLGGDSDTLACITGSIAQAYYKEIPESIITEMRKRLPKLFWIVMEQLETKMTL